MRIALSPIVKETALWISVFLVATADFVIEGDTYLCAAYVGILWLGIRLIPVHQIAMIAVVGLISVGGFLMSYDVTSISTVLNRIIVIGVCILRLYRLLNHVSVENLSDPFDTSNSLVLSDTELDFQVVDPGIDLMPKEEFQTRLERASVFTEAQIEELCHAQGQGNRLDKALRQLVFDEVVTEFQAVNILWGREDRLRVGDYSLLGVVGTGGMGAVYRAANIKSGELVALKILNKRAKYGKRFHREMRLVQQLAHPNVVVAYEVGETADKYFIAMELVDGIDLHRVVDQNGPIAQKKAWEYILQSARALEQAHDRGIVHRDVKPGNLLLDSGGNIKLADLGLSVSSASDNGDTESFHTMDGSVFGTIDFMAPEQASKGTECTPQSDIYSLGQTLFFLLTERSRVKGGSAIEKAANLTVRRYFRPLPAGTLSLEATRVFNRMVAYNAHDRFSSMTEVVEAMESVQEEFGEVSDSRRVHVLVVEDSAAQMFVTVEMLKRSNKSIQTTEVRTLRDALDRCLELSESDPIDIVLLDLSLPDSAGVETVSRFREQMPLLPIIVMTGDNRLETGESCVQAGADEFLPKDDLTATVMERSLFVTLSRFRSRR